MESRKKGFTLMELLVVIGIIGILASIMIWQLSSAKNKANEAKAKLELSSIERGIMQMSIDTNEWPNHQFVDCTNTGSLNEVADLNSAVAGLVTDDSNPNQYDGWHGPYLQYVPVDPWGNNYFFDTDYYVDSNNKPCDQNGGTVGCTVVVAIGSLGQYADGGINDYDADNVIKIMSRNSTCN